MAASIADLERRNRRSKVIASSPQVKRQNFLATYVNKEAESIHSVDLHQKQFQSPVTSRQKPLGEKQVKRRRSELEKKVKHISILLHKFKKFVMMKKICIFI